MSVAYLPNHFNTVEDVLQIVVLLDLIATVRNQGLLDCHLHKDMLLVFYRQLGRAMSRGSSLTTQ